MRFTIPNDWRLEKLSCVAEVQTGIAKGKKDIEHPVDLPYLRVANVQDGYLDLTEIKTITVAARDVERFRLKSGDVLFTEGGDADKLGRGTVWANEVDVCLHQNHVFAVRVDETQLIPKFLAVYASSYYGKSYFLSCSKQSTNLASINTKQLKNMPLPLPSVSEQRAIVERIAIWDRAIELIEKLIAAKQKLKQAVMLRILAGSTARPTILNSVLCGFRDPVDVELATSYMQIGIRSHGKGIFHKEQVTGKSLGSKRVYWVKPGCFTFNVVFAWEQAVARTTSNESGMIASHRFPMYEPIDNRVDIDYLLYFFKTERGKHLLGLASPGGAGRNRTLSQDAFMKLKIPLPKIEEQRRVANLLGTADREIEVLKQLRESYAQQKKGLMQQLLTGKTRVKLPKGIA
ncbi:MAG: restriction endonuclease subunit S [Pirellulaceae bacterium]|nr:restriction endonuclease subunit S [Pirellulaceae bacterium]